MANWQRLDAATRDLPAPLAAIDVAALAANADDLVRRAGRLPVRIATKSVRCRAVLSWALAREGFAGLMAYSLAEAIWLVEQGHRDVLLAYPTTDVASLALLRSRDDLRSEITVMVDDPQQLALIRRAGDGGRVRVCLDVDASLRVGPAHLGVRRSPVHTVGQARSAARVLAADPSVRLIGLMFYDAQIAGLPDDSAPVRAVKALSAAELRWRRPRIVDAVSALATLEIINVGGTGSLDVVAQDGVATEATAGSGLYAPTLFDGYRDFAPDPALGYALPVTRRPAPTVRTLFGGGYVASGPVAESRRPTPVWPPGLEVLPLEGVGEVQTPVTGPGATALAVGDRVWWRHAKAGEVLERFDAVHLVDAGGGVRTAPTYRGEGRTFG